MHEIPASYQGPKVTVENDPRITRVGGWLRDTKLNELPQLWNVLVGEMSLIGPRPEDPEIVETWPTELKNEILSIRPGITSPASVLFRDEESMLTNESLMETYFGIIQPTKLRLDQLYVRHRSFWVDIDVLLWTFIGFFPGLSKIKPPERLLLGGMISRGADYITRWFVIDFLISLLAVSASVLFWRSFGPFDVGFWKTIIEAILFSIVFTVIGTLFGIQKIQWAKAAPSEIIELAASSIISTLILLFANQYHYQLPSVLITTSAVMVFFGMVIARYRYRVFTGFASRWLRFRKGGDIYRERILIIGSGDAGSYAAWMLSNSKDAGKFNVVGYLDDDFHKYGNRYRGIEVLGNTQDIKKIVKEYDIGVILFAIHKISEDRKADILETCKSTKAQVIIFPDIIGHLSEVIEQNGHFHEDESSSTKLESDSSSNGREEKTFSSWDANRIEMLAIIKELQNNLKNSNVEKCLENIATLQDLINRQDLENIHE
jgi:hypothetical protein